MGVREGPPLARGAVSVGVRKGPPLAGGALSVNDQKFRASSLSDLAAMHPAAGQGDACVAPTEGCRPSRGP